MGREKEEERPLSGGFERRNASYATCRHYIYLRPEFARDLLIVYLRIKATPCMDRELHVCGWLTPSFSFRGNTVVRWRDSRDLLFQEWYLTQYHVTKVDPSHIMSCTFLRKMPVIHILWKKNVTLYNVALYRVRYEFIQC